MSDEGRNKTDFLVNFHQCGFITSSRLRPLLLVLHHNIMILFLFIISQILCSFKLFGDCPGVEQCVFMSTLFKVGVFVFVFAIVFVFVFCLYFEVDPFQSWRISFAASWPDDDKLFIATRASCDPNPPTYCSNRVAGQTKSCFILFINPGKKKGGLGREWGVLWRRNAIHIMSGSLTFQRSRNACKPQTSGKM